MKTKGFIAEADRVAISSSEKAQLKLNPDGTVDLYFGSKPPAGHVSSDEIQPNGNFARRLEATSGGAA
jgi:hypothetical protein